MYETRVCCVCVLFFVNMRVATLTHEASPGCCSMAYDHGRVYARRLEIFQAGSDLLGGEEERGRWDSVHS